MSDEHLFLPTADDVVRPAEVKEPAETIIHDAYDIVGGNTNKRAHSAAVAYRDGRCKGLIKFEFSKMDAWFEEEDEIYVHAKDSYKVTLTHLHLTWNSLIVLAACRRAPGVHRRPYRG